MENLSFNEILLKRRSIRQYLDRTVSKEDLTKIVESALLAPSGRNRRPADLAVVTDRETLVKLSECREHGSSMLKNAGAAIVMMCDPEKTDVFVEDSSIIMTIMQLKATDLGVGSCWMQVRLREAPNGESTSEYVKKLLSIPEKYEITAIMALGYTDDPMNERPLDKELFSKVFAAKAGEELRTFID